MITAQIQAIFKKYPKREEVWVRKDKSGYTFHERAKDAELKRGKDRGEKGYDPFKHFTREAAMKTKVESAPTALENEKAKTKDLEEQLKALQDGKQPVNAQASNNKEGGK